ncbi:hypothetical protein [Phocaeicola sp.]
MTVFTHPHHLEKLFFPAFPSRFENFNNPIVLSFRVNSFDNDG